MHHVVSENGSNISLLSGISEEARGTSFLYSF